MINEIIHGIECFLKKALELREKFKKKEGNMTNRFFLVSLDL